MSVLSAIVTSVNSSTATSTPTTSVGYTDRRALSQATDKDAFQHKYEAQLAQSTTLYVGNLSVWTTEAQLWCVVRSLGCVVRDIVMGLHREERTPAGFCFIVLATRAEAELAVRCLNGAVIDDRVIRVDFDRGGDVRGEGRYWARGWTGGQVRDEYRTNVDLGRRGQNSRQRWAAKAAGLVTEMPSMLDDGTVVERLPCYEWLEFNIDQWRQFRKREKE